MLSDLRAYDEARARIAAGEEVVPAEVTFPILDGANSIAVWRKHRNLTQQELAAQAEGNGTFAELLECAEGV